MRKILVPFDGSESARRAVQHAVELAKASPDVKVDLLHVLEWTPAGSRVDAPAETIDKENAAEAEEAVRPAKEIAQQAGVTCEVRYRRGSPPTEISNAVREGSYDAVIMGTRGLSPMASLMVGSVAMKVLNLVQVPVTLVK